MLGNGQAAGGRARSGRAPPPPLEVRCRTPADVAACLAIGGCFRRTADSGLNTRSSRAHTVVVARPVPAGSRGRPRGVLRLVDLAGAEPAESAAAAAASGARGGASQAAESAHILCSLEALERCFRAARDGSRIDVAACALTQLLAPALRTDLGSQLLVLAHVHEGLRWLPHSLHTLDFARLACECDEAVGGGFSRAQLEARLARAGGRHGVLDKLGDASADWAAELAR
ncbi:P-loop containing nucleoside triphosphate hydrolase protein [Pavlovales sp. CCMP2436]|nr:P-loop containing nucleoside triphosphate hydrolase protein [Pavlovales sp. CCMP2436]|eukprot:CAMPEP_0179837802 /NCGR_PEP_ID=MMETSP0982-20121206/264_1 /TAXON_ID=483367 /ORGANISM="non described non described, Strain CCMP 2436" /LENGTH=228 /DNA_ID=CAMNT_0021720985 /DNA_START=60 /DNA_END=746 /DNA_ORIENTATION=+